MSEFSARAVPAPLFGIQDSSTEYDNRDIKNPDIYLAVLRKYDADAEHAAHSAVKLFLDSFAQFIDIVKRGKTSRWLELSDARRDVQIHGDGLFYRYRATKQSLCLALRSGISPSSILEHLRQLVLPDDIPAILVSRINAPEKYKHHFEVVLQARQFDGRFEYWLCSNEYSWLSILTGNSDVLACLDTHSVVDFRQTNNNRRPGTGIKNAEYCVKVSTKCQSPECRDPYHRHYLSALKDISDTQLGIKILEEFDYTEAHGPDDAFIDCQLSKTTRVRDYQKYAVNRVFWDPFKAHSGILVLPCGAGKTLVGISIMATIKRPTIIFCQSALAVDQWREQIRQFTNLSGFDIIRLASKYTEQESTRNMEPAVVVTTYNMFTSATETNRSERSMHWIRMCQNRHWGLVILDEVHQVPAETFQRATTVIKTHVKIGLTATLVREDDGIADLDKLVGPCLAQFDIFTLRSRGYISDVHCTEIHCDMSPKFLNAYDEADSVEERRLYMTVNPEKARLCASLIKMHMARKRKVMVFCDDLFGLHWYASLLLRDKVDGSMSIEERSRLLSRFRANPNGDCLLFSKVGDQSIDLPEASVVIQLAISQASRMQELQRIGRVQRPAQGKCEAWFYSLVSSDTVEPEYAEKRGQYLRQHGYTVRRSTAQEELKLIAAEYSIQPMPVETLNRVEDNLITSIRAEIKNRGIVPSSTSETVEMSIGGTSRKRKRALDNNNNTEPVGSHQAKQDPGEKKVPASAVAKKWAKESVRK